MAEVCAAEMLTWTRYIQAWWGCPEGGRPSKTKASDGRSEVEPRSSWKPAHKPALPWQTQNGRNDESTHSPSPWPVSQMYSFRQPSSFCASSLVVAAGPQARVQQMANSTWAVSSAGWCRTPCRTFERTRSALWLWWQERVWKSGVCSWAGFHGGGAEGAV